MNSVRTKTFKQGYKKLPLHIQAKAKERYRLFRTNPQHASFQIKRIRKTEKSKAPLLEYAIDREYRAACYLDGDTYVRVFIGYHSEFDKLYS